MADLGTTVNRYLRATLGDAVPFFKRIEAGGSLHAALRATLAKDETALDGRVEAKGVVISAVPGYKEKPPYRYEY